MVPVDNSDALQNAIARLLDDDALFVSLRDGALATVVDFAWDEIAQSRLRDYRRIKLQKAGLLQDQAAMTVSEI